MQKNFGRADILRYVQSEMSAEETKAFEALLKTDEKLMEEVSFFLNMDQNISKVKEEELKEALEGAELSADEIDVEEIIKEGNKPSSGDHKAPSPAKNGIAQYVGKVLIGICLLFGGYLAYHFIF